MHGQDRKRRKERGEVPPNTPSTWLGNTQKIAMKHYLMATEADFAKAARRTVEKAAQNPAQLSDDSDTKSGTASVGKAWQDIANFATTHCEETVYAIMRCLAKICEIHQRRGQDWNTLGKHGEFAVS
jgi:hypothetical protein